MIDFRYHVVSLVAVFLALSVGIVLGAGPLREELSATLEGEVSELREERNGLRAELDDTARRAEAKEDLVTLLSGPVAAERLAGARVVLVLMPGSDPNLADDIETTVALSGGSVVATTQVLPDAERPDAAATRYEVAEELAPLLDEPEPRQGSEPTFQTVLAATLAGADEAGQVGQWGPAELRMEELDLIEMDWAETTAEQEQIPGAPHRRPAEAAIVVSGGLDAATVDEPEGAERLELRLDLVAALGAAQLPTVVVSAGTDEYQDPAQIAQDPLVAAVRSEGDIAENVSTVDNGERRAGQLVAVLTLGHALQGEFGHWGLGPDAEAVSPSVPTSPTVEDDDAGATGPIAPTGLVPGGESTDDGTDAPSTPTP